jgi:Uma2 family endonuclease
MRMAQKLRRWTRADLQDLPDDGNRYEVLDGALLVTPMASFDHQYVVSRLFGALTAYCEEHRLGRVVTPGAVVFGGNELQPRGGVAIKA